MGFRIYIGSVDNPSWYFEDSDSFGAVTTQKVALVGKQLSIDTFEPIVEEDESNLRDIHHFVSSDGHEIQLADSSIYVLDVSDGVHVSNLINLEYGTPVWYYRETRLIGKFYVSNVTRQGLKRYQINCISAIGLLDKMYHGGGLFRASTFGAVLAHILAEDIHGTGNSVIEYAIDDDVASLPVSGWLPKATKRENLYQLIFANGVNIIKNADGNLRFTFIWTAPASPEEIPIERIYDLGSVEYEKPYSTVNVTEHTFTALSNESPVTLFDNTDGGQLDGEEIWFTNAPVIVSTLSATEGLTIVSATENSAVLTGTGVLTGIPYTHTKRVLTATEPTGVQDKTASVENCTMVNIVNSNNLLTRLSAYYQPSGLIRTIRNSVVYDWLPDGSTARKSLRAGKAYQFSNPFMETETAYLAAMTIRASQVFKADCEWRANYTPAGQAGLYQHVAILVPVWDEETEQWVYTGEWTVPDDVDQIRAVIISGGTGGGSGWPGQNGGDAYCHTNVEQDADISSMWYGAEGGEGGAGGTGGAPGRAKSVTLNVTPGDILAYTIGQGGAGGASTGFIRDTLSELRAALENENPGGSWTDEQIQAMIAQEATSWNGTPNAGVDGTSTTLTDGTTTWSTADADAYVPTGGVYEPITDQFFALKGNTGIRGGKGGARKVQSGGTFNWVTDGEDVRGEDGTVYHGGRTGRPFTSVSGLPEADLIAYGGNGAGAAVGLERSDHPHMDGGSDQSASWEVTTD